MITPALALLQAQAPVQPLAITPGPEHFTAWLVFTIPDPARIDGRSLIALAVVVVLAAIGGIGFSWRRYFRRR